MTASTSTAAGLPPIGPPADQEMRALSGTVGARTSATSHPLVVGLDLSLASTGIAHHSPSGHVEDTLYGRGTGIVRLRRLAHDIKQLCGPTVELVVVDNGVGTPTRPAEGSPARVGGLDGLRDRLRSAGGQVEASSTGAGFRLVASIPSRLGVRP